MLTSCLSEQKPLCCRKSFHRTEVINQVFQIQFALSKIGIDITFLISRIYRSCGTYIQFHTGRHSAINEVNYWANFLRGKNGKQTNVGRILPKSAMAAVLAQNVKLSVTIFTATNEKNVPVM